MTSPFTDEQKEALIAALCEGLKEGTPLTVVCDRIGLDVSTHKLWRSKNVDFANRIDAAFELGIDAIAHRSRLTARGKKEDEGGESTGSVDRDKLVIWHDLKLIQMWDTRYKKTVLLGNDPQNPLTSTPAQLTRDQLLAIAAGGVHKDGGVDPSGDA